MVLLGALIEAAMLVVFAEDRMRGRASARRR